MSFIHLCYRKHYIPTLSSLHGCASTGAKEFHHSHSPIPPRDEGEEIFFSPPPIPPTVASFHFSRRDFLLETVKVVTDILNFEI